ncbi:reverse transcriptase domain-containing protein [Tanacetum coccineum]
MSSPTQEEEEAEEEEKEESKKKGSKEASEIGSNSESSGYATSDNEVESDLESTVRSEPKNGGNENSGNIGCSYKAFLACNPRDYDGKGGAVALTRWIEKMESVIARGCEAAIGMTWVEFKALLVEEFCPSNKMEKLESEFWNHTIIRANHAGYTNRFHELAKLVPHLSAILKAGILTDEAVRCGTLTRSSEKRKEMEETSKQGGSWKDNKKEKVGKGFVATTHPRNENVGSYSKCAKCSAYHPESRPFRMGNNQRVCYECGSSEHLHNTCPKLNRAPGQAGNRILLLKLNLLPNHSPPRNYLDPNVVIVRLTVDILIVHLEVPLQQCAAEAAL